MGKPRSAKHKALDDALRAMYRAVETRPIPDRLKSVIDQLDAGDAELTPPPAAVRRQG